MSPTPSLPFSGKYGVKIGAKIQFFFDIPHFKRRKNNILIVFFFIYTKKRLVQDATNLKYK